MSGKREYQLTVAFDGPLYQQLVEQAKESDRSLNAEIRRRLRSSLEQQPDLASPE